MKPITIAIEDCKNSLAKDINDSGLPMAIIEMILNDLHQQSQQLAKQELELDRKEQEKEESKNKND